jgi:hypothetical protein
MQLNLSKPKNSLHHEITQFQLNRSGLGMTKVATVWEVCRVGDHYLLQRRGGDTVPSLF